MAKAVTERVSYPEMNCGYLSCTPILFSCYSDYFDCIHPESVIQFSYISTKGIQIVVLLQKEALL